jgi:DNA-binding LacI/PurR family transcriptional regulator
MKYIRKEGIEMPATSKVIHYIRTLLARDSNAKIPPLRTLAAACNVCYATAAHAVLILKRNGEIETVQGGGIYRPGQRRSPPPHTAPQHKWEIVRERIAEDIMQGRYRPGSVLPPLKVLQARYNASYPSVKKALDHLCTVHALERHGQYMRIPRHTAHDTRSKIILVGPGNEPGKILLNLERVREFYRLLHLECSLAEISIETAVYNDFSPKGGVFLLEGKPPQRQLQPDDWVQGFIVLALNINDVRELLFRLHLHKKPIALWWQRPWEIARTDSIHLRRLVTFFDIDRSGASAEAVGQFLLERGHTSVAYVSPIHNNYWSKGRLEGLRRVYRRAGISRVDAFTVEGFESDWEYMHRLNEYFGDKKPQISFPKDIPGAVRKQARSVCFEYYRDAFIMEKISPLVEGIVGANRYTALVGVNDHAALLLRSLLQEREIDIPGEISLVGFDDAFESLTHGLTTYNFNVPALTHAIIETVLGTYRPRKQRDLVIEIKGQVIDRGSVRHIKPAAVTALPVSDPT